MNLNELLIISKYLNFKDVKQLIEINPDLKYYFHSTFDLINIPSNYIVPIHQVKKIINNLKSIFPNLEEIILNIYNDLDLNVGNSTGITIPKNFNNILTNYINFDNVANSDSKIEIKMKMHDILKSTYLICLSDLKLYTYLISKLFSSNSNPIYIYIDLYDVDNDELIKLCRKYPSIIFIHKLLYNDEELDPMNKRFVDKNNSIIEYFKDVPNMLYSYLCHKYLFFKNINDNNPYMRNYLLYRQTKFNLINIYEFQNYYNIMKLTSILNKLIMANSKINIRQNEKEINEDDSNSDDSDDSDSDSDSNSDSNSDIEIYKINNSIHKFQNMYFGPACIKAEKSKHNKYIGHKIHLKKLIKILNSSAHVNEVYSDLFCVDTWCVEFDDEIFHLCFIIDIDYANNAVITKDMLGDCKMWVEMNDEEYEDLMQSIIEYENLNNDFD